MRAQLSLALLLVIVSGSCGGTATSAAPAVLATPTAASPPTASATPLTIATVSPTAAATTTASPTPDPTLVVEVRSDADVDRLFVGLTADELSAQIKETADAGYRFAVPFDPHGARFQLRTQSVALGQTSPFQMFGVVLLSGSVTLKLHGPGVYVMRKEILFEAAGPRYLIVPTDQDIARPDMAFQMGARGVFVDATLKGELIPPMKFGDVGAAPKNVSSRLGTAILRIDATMPPLGGPIPGVWARAHIVIHGAGINGYKDGAPISEKSLLRAPDGRIVYIRCQLQFDGTKWVQVCPGG